MKQQETRYVDLRNLSLTALLTHEAIERAAVALQQEQLVVFPTETVYGVGANAYSETAVQSIFTAKERPSDNPLIVHFADQQQVERTFPTLSIIAKKLMIAFWPGPLTLIVPHRKTFPKSVTAGLSTVAVRVPDHPIAAALLHKTNQPIAAPSANRSGRPSPTQAEHAWRDLQGRVALVLDGGSTTIGLESTVIDLSTEVPTILRPGGVTYEMLVEEIGLVHHAKNDEYERGSPRSPGMRYRHYAPTGELWLIRGSLDNMRQAIQERASAAMALGKRVGVLTTSEGRGKYRAMTVMACGSRADPASVAQHLYECLHQFDQQQIELIYSETFPMVGTYVAVMNRLHKAAAGREIFV